MTTADTQSWREVLRLSGTPAVAGTDGACRKLAAAAHPDCAGSDGCALCGSDHEPGQPHNGRGLLVRAHRTMLGASPSVWAEAKERCPLALQSSWTETLAAFAIDAGALVEMPHSPAGAGGCR